MGSTLNGRSRGHVVVACDKFKGSLTAQEVAGTVAAGIHDGAPGVPVDTVLVADGGDGTLQALAAAGWALQPVVASGPTGRPVLTSYATRGGTAVVELADVCGLARLPEGRLAPLEASTYGLGEVIRAALDAGHRDIVLAVGGSASSDGGAGMLSALGARLLTADGTQVQAAGGSLVDVVRLDLENLDPRIRDARFLLASDVRNPLLGLEGAVAVYGEQKGATGVTAARLEAGLERWTLVVSEATGSDDARSPGAGAAGGVGFGAMAVLGARVRSGVDLVLELVGFEGRLHGAALVVTGEGSLDIQTLHGKTVMGVAAAARRAGVRSVAVCGRSTLSAAQARAVGIDEVFTLLDLEPDVEKCMREAAPLLRRVARTAVVAYVSAS